MWPEISARVLLKSRVGCEVASARRKESKSGLHLTPLLAEGALSLKKKKLFIWLHVGSSSLTRELGIEPGPLHWELGVSETGPPKPS